MKMNKLFSSIAASAMVLTALAPAAVANASNPTAKETGAMDYQGSAAKMPVAAASANGTTTSGVAHSDANVNVIAGMLSLDAVPSLSFGNAVAGGKAAVLESNTKTAHLEKDADNVITNDGNDQGNLVITDSRTDASNNGLGYQLNVQLDVFKDSQEKTATNGWVLTIPKLNSTDTGALPTKPVSLEDNNKSNALLVVAPGHGYGSTTFDMSPQNVKNTMKLSVPNGVAPDSYKSIMTWTLYAKAQ